MINRKNKIYYYDLYFRKLKNLEQNGTHIGYNILKISFLAHLLLCLLYTSDAADE